MITVSAYTDGGYSSKSKLGAWAYTTSYNNGKTIIKRESSSSCKNTTSQEMEVIAILKCLYAIPTKVGLTTIYSDSRYCVESFNSWIGKWLKNGWKKADGTKVIHRVLFEEAIRRIEVLKSCGMSIQFKHVSAHIGIAGNEYVDNLVRIEIRRS